MRPTSRRTLVAVVTVDGLLGALGLDNDRRLAWLKTVVNSRKEVGDEYRARRRSLVTVLRDARELAMPISDILSKQTAAIAPIADRLAKIEATRGLIQPLSKLYESYVHMHCNRLGIAPTIERRVLGLLLRARETMAHLPTIISENRAASMAALSTQT